MSQVRSLTMFPFFRPPIMNRFLKNKKAAREAASDDSASFNAPQQKEKKWKRGKKAPLEQKPQLDLSTALPSSDDFRTSLIMPNLSARFSMLREQDDPNSKIGKASDDSVLQPRRQSNLNFGFPNTGLSDIAEVSSINSSLRRPFAGPQRQDSYGSEDGAGTGHESPASGGVMSRARPGESNFLFGGRQKIYRVPASASSKSLNTDQGGMGRTLYENDVNLSAFQRHRQEEKEAAANAGAEEVDNSSGDLSGFNFSDEVSHTQESQPMEVSPSPASSHHKRSTSTTSTTPSQRRASTAATSVGSQGTAPAAVLPPPTSAPPKAPLPDVPQLQRSMTKRRLYEQGLDQHMHEQQASNLTRLNSIQRQRTIGGRAGHPVLNHARSMGNMHDRSYQPYAVEATSPPPTLTTFGSIRIPSNNASPGPSYPQSPTSPVDLDPMNPLSSAINPEDRGKATALGAFNKPAQQFDEQQYLQRQLQLQKSMENVRKASLDRTPQFQQLTSARYEPETPRSESQASQRSRSQSVSRQQKDSPEPAKAFAVFQNAALHMRAAQADSTQSQHPALRDATPEQEDPHRTFFGDISGSEDEDEEDSAPAMQSHAGYNSNGHPMGGRFQGSTLPSVSEHPAFRADAFNMIEEEDVPEVLPLRPQPSAQSMQSDVTSKPQSRDEERDFVSPAPSSNEALSGLVREHLRNDSNQSSIYPMPNSAATASVPSLSDMTSRTTRHTFNSGRLNSTYTNSNPWDLEDFESSYYYQENDRKSQAMHLESRSSIQPLAPNMSKGNIDSNRSSAAPEGASWQEELKNQQQHTRDPSTTTQAEREAFANELAARQKAIQENLKSIVESQSRNTSPAPSESGAMKAFNMLRAKPSRESVAARDQPAKAMKMLGLGSGPAAASATSLHDRYRVSEESVRTPPQGQQRTPPSSGRRDRSMSRARGDSETSNAGFRRPSAPTNQSRARSNSAASTGRSRGRAYRDDTEMPNTDEMAAGANASMLDPLAHQQLTPRPSPDMHQHPSAVEQQARFRSNSRPPPPGQGYFEQKNLQPLHINAGRFTPGAHSPASAGLSPGPNAFHSGRPSPIASPYSAHGTPPLPYQQYANTPPSSTATTPLLPSTQAPTVPTLPVGKTGPLLRKKTVLKSEIGDPVLVSSTSNVDTVDLPPGASLRNGMDDVDAGAPPAVPSMNPRRRKTQRLFGFGRDGAQDEGGRERERERRVVSPTSDRERRVISPIPIPTANANEMRERDGMMSPPPLSGRSIYASSPMSPPLSSGRVTPGGGPGGRGEVRRLRSATQGQAGAYPGPGQGPRRVMSNESFEPTGAQPFPFPRVSNEAKEAVVEGGMF
ncbi:hypothetical protein M8818_007455 [Zalaria obscura]|uniref:Uncharacterized protein n=1 Tax=Zalaria obscura TaxID=2024903 RepID=A0ACC3S413_9PEZI